MVILTLTEKGGEPQQLSFDKDEIVVGRVQGNDIVLAKGNVSKRHCRIYLQEGHFSIEDLKSTNGTYVNGRKIGEPTAVSTADKIYVGDFVLRVDNATRAEVPTPAPPANEAGALASALKRPPPPPPPSRATGTQHALEDDAPPVAKPPSGGRIAPPPPLPPPRAAAPPLKADLPPPPGPPAAAADIDLDDEEPLAAQPPKLNVPPLKPPPAIAASLVDEEEDEIPTATRDGGVLQTAAIPTYYPNWLRKAFEGGATSVYLSGTKIELERQGRRAAGSASDQDSEELIESLRALAERGTPRPDGNASVIDLTLPDGARLTALLPPIATQLSAAIHRPSSGSKTLADLVVDGALSKEMQQVLEACSSTRRNVLLAGDRRATETIAKTLAHTIGAKARVVVIADRVAPPNGNSTWIQVVTDPTTEDLVAAAVALRPDYLFADLSRVEIVAELLNECALGQEGTFAVIAGRSAQDALARMLGLASSYLGVGAKEIIAGGFDVVVHSATLADGTMRVLEVAEPKLDSDGRLVAEPLLTWRPDEGRGGGGHFQATGVTSRLAATLSARGAQVPTSVLRR